MFYSSSLFDHFLVCISNFSTEMVIMFGSCWLYLGLSNPSAIPVSVVHLSGSEYIVLYSLL